MTVALPTASEITAALIAREELPPEKGDIGPQGLQGPDGQFGPPGPQGPKGDPGRNGVDGAPGDLGPVGPQGEQGDRGLKGDKGDKGDEGDRGEQGPIGPTGASGTGRSFFPRGGGSSGGSGLPSGGTVGQVVTNTAPGAGTWQDGSGLPPQWTDGGNGDVTAEVDDPTKAPFTVDTSADNNFADAIVIRVPDPANLTGNGYIFRVYDPVNNLVLADLDAYGSFAIFGNALGGNVGGIDIYNTAGNVAVFRAHTDGVVELNNGVVSIFSMDPAYRAGIFNEPVLLAKTTVPADADIFAGSAALWFDKTNGGADLEVKAKTADGTVVTQEFPIGVTPQTYAASNVTTDRTYDANATTIDELADVLGTLIADLRARKLVA